MIDNTAVHISEVQTGYENTNPLLQGEETISEWINENKIEFGKYYNGDLRNITQDLKRKRMLQLAAQEAYKGFDAAVLTKIGRGDIVGNFLYHNHIAGWLKKFARPGADNAQLIAQLFEFSDTQKVLYDLQSLVSQAYPEREKDNQRAECMEKIFMTLAADVNTVKQTQATLSQQLAENPTLTIVSASIPTRIPFVTLCLIVQRNGSDPNNIFYRGTLVLEATQEEKQHE